MENAPPTAPVGKQTDDGTKITKNPGHTARKEGKYNIIGQKVPIISKYRRKRKKKTQKESFIFWWKEKIRWLRFPSDYYFRVGERVLSSIPLHLFFFSSPYRILHSVQPRDKNLSLVQPEKKLNMCYSGGFCSILFALLLCVHLVVCLKWLSANDTKNRMEKTEIAKTYIKRKNPEKRCRG